MPLPPDPVKEAAFRVGYVKGRREAIEAVVRLLRQGLSRWRKEDAAHGAGVLARMGAALRWSVVEEWSARLTKLVDGDLETELTNLRASEPQLLEELERAMRRPWWRRGRFAGRGDAR